MPSTKRKLVHRLFEIASVGSQPPPGKGVRITTVGRFFKYRAIPITVDRERDRKNQIQRQSDQIYAMLIVAPGFTVVPPAPEFIVTPPMVIGAVIVALLFLGALVLWLNHRERLSAHAPHRVPRAGRRAKTAPGEAKSPPGDPPKPPVDQQTPPIVP